MNQISTTKASVDAYVSWYNSGTVQQTEMNTQPFGALFNECTIALNQLSSIDSSIQTLHKIWQNVTANPSASEIILVSSTLRGLSSLANALVATATNIKSQCVVLETSVGAQKVTINSNLTALNAQLATARIYYSFFTHFLARFKLTFDNKAFDNETNAETTAYYKALRIQQCITSIHASQAALHSCSGALSELDNLIGAATDLQNSINSTYAQSNIALTDADNAGKSDSPIVVKTFMGLASAAISSLINNAN